MKLNDLHQVKTLVGIAMSQPTRQLRARLLRFAFLGAVRAQREIRDSEMLPADRERLDSFNDALDWTGKPSRNGDDADRREIAFIQNHYPQLALACDLGSAIFEMIGRKRLWREYGFQSHDEWYQALDNESYLEQQMEELKTWET